MDEKLMTFWEHISELRRRAVYSVIFVIAGFFAAYAFHKEIFDIMTVPVMKGLKSYGFTKLQAISVQEMILVYFKQSLIFGIAIASPFILYQIWAFVAPGLYPKEKRVVLPALFISTLFFIAGALFCYFIFLPLVIKFLISFSVENSSVMVVPTVKNSYIVVLGAMLVFGFLFELPIIMFFLALIGVVNSMILLKFFRYFVLIAFVVGGLLTPPDPISQILMAAPMCLLYLIGLGAVYLLELFRGGEQTGKAAKVVRAITAFCIIAILIATTFFSLNHFNEKVGDKEIESAAPPVFSLAYGFASNLKYREKFPVLPDRPVYLKKRTVLSGVVNQEERKKIMEPLKSCSIAWFYYPEIDAAVNDALFALCESKQIEYITGCFKHDQDYIFAEITMKLAGDGHDCLEGLRTLFKEFSGFKGELLDSIATISDGDFDYEISDKKVAMTFFIEKKRELKLTKMLHKHFAMISFYDKNLYEVE